MDKSGPQGPTESFSAAFVGILGPNYKPTRTTTPKNLRSSTCNSVSYMWKFVATYSHTLESCTANPIASNHVQFHDDILHAMQYSNYKAFILFTIRMGQQQLPMVHWWSNLAVHAIEHHSRLFLPLRLAQQWRPYCAISRSTCVVGSAEWDPRVVEGEGSQSVARCRGLWARI